MKYKELQKCELPVEVIDIDHGEVFIINAYNSKGVLFTEKRSGEDKHDDIDFLQFVELKPQIITVKLYKYNYYDKMLKGTFSTKWTTEGFSQHFNVYDDLELRSTEVKTVEIED